MKQEPKSSVPIFCLYSKSCLGREFSNGIRIKPKGIKYTRMYLMLIIGCTCA